VLFRSGIEVVPLPTAKSAGGALEPAALAPSLDDRTACVVVQQPNFLGSVEDLAAIAAAAPPAGPPLVLPLRPPTSRSPGPPGPALSITRPAWAASGGASS